MQKPLTPSGVSCMDIINVRRRRKRNSLDVLILSPLAQINRSFENNLRRGKHRFPVPLWSFFCPNGNSMKVSPRCHKLFYYVFLIKKKTKSLNTAWIFLFRHLLHLLMWFDAIFYKRAKHEEIYGRLLGSYERFRHVLPKKAIRWNMCVRPSRISLNLLDEILLCSLSRDMFRSIISLTTFFIV